MWKRHQRFSRSSFSPCSGNEVIGVALVTRKLPGFAGKLNPAALIVSSAKSSCLVHSAAHFSCSSPYCSEFGPLTPSGSRRLSTRPGRPRPVPAKRGKLLAHAPEAMEHRKQGPFQNRQKLPRGQVHIRARRSDFGGEPPPGRQKHACVIVAIAEGAPPLDGRARRSRGRCTVRNTRRRLSGSQEPLPDARKYPAGRKARPRIAALRSR